ncbi:serine/threonine protein kinase [Microbacterium sp. CFH 90308]|uniref:non-specific serine/threonine protein kinase n=1 Tax=Microbacterium salsuginis TaxID=2722803 RepID=A0ABX1K9F4_9MICO|nr:serine/threonine-protein kinase [Microbacterium sp. CFH 90308]NLP82689.1 serine/threonine protein kinase [Microbacterium sp. CFH 90308]
MTDLREAGDISTGELLDGRYRLEHRIGEGGMARVYRALDTHLNRTVAIKVLRGAIDAPEVLERAQAETRLLASLNHHSIVTVFDARISESAGSYIVMECVQGDTLRDRIRQGPIDECDVATIAVDIAEALHVAHSAGIVHRDIKPSNVLLGPSPLPGPTWRAKLADFGIAFLLDTTRVTTPGMVVGTPAYIAPEQAQGAAPAPPSDVYAFGLMLIEALTGTRPYEGAEGIGALVARLITSPEIPDSLSPEWQGLLRGMTATRPDDRPTALEVATSAARLAAASAVASVDLPTQAAPLPTSALPPVAAAGAAGGAMEGAVVGQEDDAPSPSTKPTAIVPVVEEPPPPLETSAPPSVGTGTGAPPEPRERDTARGRRRLIAGLVAAAVMIVAIAGLVWAMNLSAGTPDPGPSAPVVEPTQQQPSQTPTQQAPPPPVEQEDSGGDDGNSGNGDQGNGDTGNGNQGNGNGTGNQGNGNGTGNQGNGTQGNGTQTETDGSETETDTETEPGNGNGPGESPAPSTAPNPTETSPAG